MIFAPVIFIEFYLLLRLNTLSLDFFYYHGLVQGLAHHGTWAKSGLPPVLLNTVLLNHSHICHLHIFYGCFRAILTELNSCDKDVIAHKAGQIYHLDLYRKRLLTLGLIHITFHISQ